MSVPVLVRHDPGCRYAREWYGGHTDAAKRISDMVNLHAAAGVRRGVVAFSLADGRSDGVVYDSREAAVAHQHHNEGWHGYIRLGPASMNVCEAASVLRFQRQAITFAGADREAPNGGLEVIPRLNAEDQARQLAAMAGRIRRPIALGKGGQ